MVVNFFQQTLSEDDLKEEDTNVFLVTCQKCLEEEQLTAVLEIIQDEKNQVRFDRIIGIPQYCHLVYVKKEGPIHFRDPNTLLSPGLRNILRECVHQ